MNHPLIKHVESKYMKETPPSFRVGDTVNVHVKITEGDKQRVQVFNGVVISRRGRGLGEMFTVRRIVGNEGVERIFPLHSPHIAKVEVIRSGKVRRAKLYYLRDRVGKARKLREKRISRSARTAASQNHPAESASSTKPSEEQPQLATVES